MPPALQRPPRSFERIEHLLVEKFVSEPPVERLDKAVLLRFAGLDVVPGDACPVLPFEDRSARQFRAVVADDCLRTAMAPDEIVKLACNTGA